MDHSVTTDLAPDDVDRNNVRILLAMAEAKFATASNLIEPLQELSDTIDDMLTACRDWIFSSGHHAPILKKFRMKDGTMTRYYAAAREMSEFRYKTTKVLTKLYGKDGKEVPDNEGGALSCLTTASNIYNQFSIFRDAILDVATIVLDIAPPHSKAGIMAALVLYEFELHENQETRLWNLTEPMPKMLPKQINPY
jgi:hypothetical protein